MRIRLKPTETHLSPLHASRGRYTRRSCGGSAIATTARSLHLSTRGFAWALPREKRGSQLQPAPAERRAAGISCVCEQ